MEIEDKKNMILIALISIIVIVWSMFFSLWYPGIKEGMEKDMDLWNKCGLEDVFE